MSRSIGPALDDALLAAFGGQELEQQAGQAVLVATLDASQRPHPALLTPAEILARGPRALRVAVGAGSNTARNLAERGALTLSLVVGGRVVYVKARARGAGTAVPGHEGVAAFDAEVEDVLVDETGPEEPITRVDGFTYDALDRGERLRAGLRLSAALRDLP